MYIFFWFDSYFLIVEVFEDDFDFWEEFVFILNEVKMKLF